VSEAVRAYRSQAVAAQASGLLQRYRQTRDLADLHAAIRLLRESVTAAPRTRIYYAQRLLTCDTIGGLEGERLADLLVLLAGWPDLRTNRGCRVARCRMSGR